MGKFELTNKERKFFGLDPIIDTWERVIFAGDRYRPESVLYFDGQIIKRHIVTTREEYFEKHFDELTRDRSVLLPKTSRGKEKKLTAATLEQRKPHGVYLSVHRSRGLSVGSYASQTSFYRSDWEMRVGGDEDPQFLIRDFIQNSPVNHLDEIQKFKTLRRKHIRFKSGDYFCMKLNRTEFGFGRVLLDIHELRKVGDLPRTHGLNLIMMMPVLVQLYAFKSDSKHIDLSVLDQCSKLPAALMADNLLLYGEYEIIGHEKLEEREFDFPISYGQCIDQRRVVFLQWGLIHKELPMTRFSKFIQGEEPYDQNPFGFYSIGFRPHYGTRDVLQAVSNNGEFDYEESSDYMARRDLRNPRNEAIRREILSIFGLNPEGSYEENCRLTGTARTTEILNRT